MTKQYEPHPLSLVFPPMSDDDFRALADDIREHGLLEPIALYEGKILDGRNRAKACAVAKVEARYFEYEGDDPTAYVIARNLHRRHLNESQRAIVAAKLETMKQGRPGKDANLHDSISRADAAAKLNVSTRSVATAKKVVTDAAPQVVAAVESGRVSLNEAAALAKLPKAAQARIAVLSNPKERRDEAQKTRNRQAGTKPKPEPPPPEVEHGTPYVRRFLGRLELLAADFAIEFDLRDEASVVERFQSEVDFSDPVIAQQYEQVEWLMRAIGKAAGRKQLMRVVK